MASDCGGYCAGAWFADASHGHAEVFAVEDHYYASGVQLTGEGVGYLGGQAFLDLGTAGIGFYQAGQFGEARNAAVGAWDVADVGHAVEGQKVVFAAGVDLNVADQDYLVVACFE